MTPDPDHWESTCERDPCAASVFFFAYRSQNHLGVLADKDVQRKSKIVMMFRCKCKSTRKAT